MYRRHWALVLNYSGLSVRLRMLCRRGQVLLGRTKFCRGFRGGLCVLFGVLPCLVFWVVDGERDLVEEEVGANRYWEGVFVIHRFMTASQHANSLLRWPLTRTSHTKSFYPKPHLIGIATPFSGIPSPNAAASSTHFTHLQGIPNHPINFFLLSTTPNAFPSGPI